jgi:hypothetical protein
MTDKNTRVFCHEKLTISASFTSAEARIDFRGESDSRDPTPFLASVTKELFPKLQGTRVQIDFRSLKYMNSATVAALLVFIRALDAQAIPTVLEYDTNVGWQRVNFNCMKTIVKTMRHIVVGG